GACSSSPAGAGRGPRCSTGPGTSPGSPPRPASPAGPCPAGCQSTGFGRRTARLRRGCPGPSPLSAGTAGPGDRHSPPCASTHGGRPPPGFLSIFVPDFAAFVLTSDLEYIIFCLTET